MASIVFIAKRYISLDCATTTRDWSQGVGEHQESIVTVNEDFLVSPNQYTGGYRVQHYAKVVVLGPLAY